MTPERKNYQWEKEEKAILETYDTREEELTVGKGRKAILETYDTREEELTVGKGRKRYTKDI